MGLEYRTTEGVASHTERCYDGSYDDHETDDPIPPDGDGWELVSAAASGPRLFWFWRRDSNQDGGEE